MKETEEAFLVVEFKHDRRRDLLAELTEARVGVDVVQQVITFPGRRTNEMTSVTCATISETSSETPTIPVCSRRRTAWSNTAPLKVWGLL